MTRTDDGAVGSGQWKVDDELTSLDKAEDFVFLNWKSPFIAPDKLNPILLINCNDMRKIIKLLLFLRGREMGVD